MKNNKSEGSFDSKEEHSSSPYPSEGENNCHFLGSKNIIDKFEISVKNKTQPDLNGGEDSSEEELDHQSLHKKRGRIPMKNPRQIQHPKNAKDNIIYSIKVLLNESLVSFFQVVTSKLENSKLYEIRGIHQSVNRNITFSPQTFTYTVKRGEIEEQRECIIPSMPDQLNESIADYMKMPLMGRYSIIPADQNYINMDLLISKLNENLVSQRIAKILTETKVKDFFTMVFIIFSACVIIFTITFI